MFLACFEILDYFYFLTILGFLKYPIFFRKNQFLIKNGTDEFL